MHISKREIRKNVMEYRLTDGRRLYLIGEGRLINLVAAEGHPSEVMDMSFSNQALAVKYIRENRERLEHHVYTLPREIDEEIALRKLESMNIKIDKLSEEQSKYLKSWELGT
jgi:adenosylhomocysteinase